MDEKKDIEGSSDELVDEPQSKSEAAEPEVTEESDEETEAKAEEEAEEEAEEGTIVKGDFVLVEMTGRADETGEVFETTDEERARSEGIYSDDRVYGPKLVVVGEGWVLKGLDDRLEGLRLGEDAEVEISPEDAFGERNPDNVRMIPFRFLRSKGINPTIGAQVELDGRSAVVRSVGAGRVQLDYNPPLAGRKIIYEVKVGKMYEGDEEKVRALIGRRFLGVDTDKFDVKLLKTKIKITVPEELFLAENIQIAKRGVALDIQRFFPDFQSVEYIEVMARRT